MTIIQIMKWACYYHFMAPFSIYCNNSVGGLTTFYNRISLGMEVCYY